MFPFVTPKTSEPKRFLMFSGGPEGNIGEKWVNLSPLVPPIHPPLVHFQIIQIKEKQQTSMKQIQNGKIA